MSDAVTRQNQPEHGYATPAAADGKRPAAPADGFGAQQPDAFSRNDELGRQALEAWSGGDDTGTRPIPVIPAAPADRAGAPLPRTPERSGPWRIIRDSLRPHRTRPGRVRPGSEPAAPASPAEGGDIPPTARSGTRASSGLSSIGFGDQGLAAPGSGPGSADVPRRAAATAEGAADTRVDLPILPAERGHVDLPAVAAGRDVDATATDLPVVRFEGSGDGEPAELPAAAVGRGAGDLTGSRTPAEKPAPAADRGATGTGLSAAPATSDLAQTRTDLPVVPADSGRVHDSAQTRTDLPVQSAAAGSGPEQTRADLPVQAAAAGSGPEQTRADLPVQSAETTRRDEVPSPRSPADGQALPVPPEPRQDAGAPAAELHRPRATPSPEEPPPGRRNMEYTRLVAQAVADAATAPLPVTRPDYRVDPGTPADAGPQPGPEAVPRTSEQAAPDARKSLWSKRRSRSGTADPPSAAPKASPPAPPSAAPPGDGAPWAPAPRPASADSPFDQPAPPPSRSWPPPSPRPSADGERPATAGPRRPATEREKDLARRNCLRLRCVCPDPTVCPALAVKRSPAGSSAQLGWQMPAQQSTKPPGVARMMSLAVASAATMPIPILPGAPSHGLATAATLPLPVLPSDALPYKDDGSARSPVGKLLARLKADHMLRNTLFLVMSTGVQAALGFAFWIVVARLFDTAAVGVGSSMISAIGLIAYFALVGMDRAVVRYLPTAKDPNSLITGAVLTVGGFGALVGAGYIFAAPMFAPKIAFVAHQPLLALGFIVLAAATTVNLLTDSVFIASRKASLTALTDGAVGGSGKIALSVALAGTGAYGVFSASAGGFAAAALASLVLLVVAVRWRPRLRNPLQILKPMIKFSFANYAGSVMQLLPTLVVPLIILDRLGPSDEAYYFVAFQLANLLYAAGGAIEQTFLAEGSQADVDWRGLLRRSLRLLGALFVPMCLIVVVGAHWVLLAFGVKYSHFGTPTLMLLAAAAIPIGANDWLQTVLRLAGALRAIVWSGVVTAVSVCAAAWLLAPFGLTVLSASWAIGTSLGALVAGIGFMAVRRRDLQQRRRGTENDDGGPPSGYEGRHVPRHAEGQPKRSEQPVG